MEEIRDMLLTCPLNQPGTNNFSLSVLNSFGFHSPNISDLLLNDSAWKRNNSCWTFEASPYSIGVKKVMDMLNIYATPFIVFFGIMGNFVSFLVFTLTHLRRQSSSVYLASLAVVHIVFLISLFVVWLSWIKIPLFHREGWCQLVVYMMYVCTFLSVWLVTSFTVDRFIFCFYPLRKERFCTTWHARLVVLLLVVLGILLYSFSTWTSGVNYIGRDSPVPVTLCMPFPKYYNAMTIITTVDSAVTLIIPCSLVIVLNIRIAYQILSMERKRQTALSHSRGPIASNCHESLSSGCPVHVRFQTHPTSTADKRTGAMLSSSKSASAVTRSRRRRSHQYRTVRMLIIVSSVFVLLNVPGHICRIHAFFQSSLHDEFSAYRKDLTWHEIFNLAYHFNFAINFVMYCVFGRQFRNGLKSLYTRYQHKRDSLRMWYAQRSTQKKLPANL